MKTITQLGAILLLMVAVDCRFSACLAQGTAFTYQGRVLDGGTNFTGAGLFKFALVTSSNANHTATATANSTANVSNGPKNDFNGDNSSDLLFQENMNSAHPNVLVELLTNTGTTIGSSAIIPDTKGWHVVAEADFNCACDGDHCKGFSIVRRDEKILSAVSN